MVSGKTGGKIVTSGDRGRPEYGDNMAGWTFVDCAQMLYFKEYQFDNYKLVANEN